MTPRDSCSAFVSVPTYVWVSVPSPPHRLLSSEAPRYLCRKSHPSGPVSPMTHSFNPSPWEAEAGDLCEPEDSTLVIEMVKTGSEE